MGRGGRPALSRAHPAHVALEVLKGAALLAAGVLLPSGPS